MLERSIAVGFGGPPCHFLRLSLERGTHHLRNPESRQATGFLPPRKWVGRGNDGRSRGPRSRFDVLLDAAPAITVKCKSMRLSRGPVPRTRPIRRSATRRTVRGDRAFSDCGPLDLVSRRWLWLCVCQIGSDVFDVFPKPSSVFVTVPWSAVFFFHNNFPRLMEKSGNVTLISVLSNANVVNFVSSFVSKV